jgi:hypothetical protein
VNWADIIGVPSSFPPGGPAGGDLSGFYPNPSISLNAVTNGKLADVSSLTFKGRISGGVGDPEDMTGTQATTLLDDFVGDAGAGGTKGLVPAPAAGDAAAGKYLDADGTWTVPPDVGITELTGDVTAGPGSGSQVATIANDAVTFAKFQNIATDRLVGRDTVGSGDSEEISVGGGVEFTGALSIQRSALTGDVTAPAGSNTTTIANDVVTFAKMQNISTDRLIGRDTAASGDPEEISVGGGVEFTGATAIQRSALTGDVTAPAGSGTTTIANDAVTYAKMQNVSATDRLLGRSTAGAGDVEEITCTAAGRALLDDADATAQRTTLGLGDSATLNVATQAEMETGTSTSVLVTPGRQAFHPGHPKCWAMVTVAAGAPTLQTSFNITSIADSGQGRLTVTIATDFSTANWCCLALVQRASTTAAVGNARDADIRTGTLAAGSVELNCWDKATTNNDLEDPESWHMAGFGDQA